MSINCGKSEEVGGAKGSRTPDLLNAIQALSQLSYGPILRTRVSGLDPRPNSLPDYARPG